MASKPTLQIASDDVRETVNKYCGILTVAEVIGLLDMIKMDLWSSAMEEDDL
jgi:hypothetical protein